MLLFTQTWFTSLLLMSLSLATTTFGFVFKMPPLIQTKPELDEEQQQSQHHHQPQSVILVPDTPLNLHLEAWSEFSPKLARHQLQSRGGNMEFQLQWTNQHDVTKVARELTCQVAPWFAYDEKLTDVTDLYSDLQMAMTTFQEFCSTSFDSNLVGAYKLKLVLMKGSSATQCPAWHMDYVPVRWIQTLCGPGCMYMDPLLYAPNDATYEKIANGHKPQLIFADDEDGENVAQTTRDWKERLVQESHLKPQQAVTGQAMLLVGKTWSRIALGHDCRPGVLHRSPHNVPEHQTRVLLVMDVILRDELEEEEPACTKGCCK